MNTPSKADRPAGKRPLFLRPEPSEWDRKTMAKRERTGRRHPERPSTEWWERGGLLVDDQGPALVDADGHERRFPSFVRGWLITFEVFDAAGAGVFSQLFSLASPVPPYVRVLELPGDRMGGLSSGYYRHFADEAGFYYVEKDPHDNFPRAPRGEHVDWWDAVRTLSDRRNRFSAQIGRRVRHPVRGFKGMPAWQVPEGWPPAPVID